VFRSHVNLVPVKKTATAASFQIAAATVDFPA